MNQSNESVVRRWFDEVWNEKRTDAIYELLAPDCISHLENEDMVGVERFHQYHLEIVQAFPGLQITVEEVISQGEAAAIRWTAKGVHEGTVFGIEPTGQEVKFRGITMVYIRDGKISEGWDSWNMGGLMLQLSGTFKD